MTAYTYRNPVYNSLGTIDCQIDLAGEWVPFTAAPHDPEPLGRQLYNEIIAAGNIAPYTPPVASVDGLKAKAQSLRREAETGSAKINVGNNRMIPSWVDSESRGSALGLVVAKTSSTVWKGADGAYYTLNAAEISALATGILDYVEKCFAAEAQIDAMINASTITTIAQVDAVFQSLML